MPKMLSTTQALRYNRHIVLPQVDLDGQEKLVNAHIVIIGLGGLGNAAASSLCASGVGKLTLLDFDDREHHNLPRQTLFNDKDVGKPKVLAAKDKLAQMNSDCQIMTVDAPISEQHLDLIKHADVVLDCTDNSDARKLINKLCYTAHTPLISGAAIRFEGQLFVALPGTSCCYNCFQRLFSSPQLSCVEAGIFSPVVNIIGTYQSLYAMQVIMGVGDLPLNTLMTFDGLSHEWQKWALPEGTHCHLCK